MNIKFKYHTSILISLCLINKNCCKYLILTLIHSYRIITFTVTTVCTINQFHFFCNARIKKINKTSRHTVIYEKEILPGTYRLTLEVTLKLFF